MEVLKATAEEDDCANTVPWGRDGACEQRFVTGDLDKEKTKLRVLEKKQKAEMRVDWHSLHCMDPDCAECAEQEWTYDQREGKRPKAGQDTGMVEGLLWQASQPWSIGGVVQQVKREKKEAETREGDGPVWARRTRSARVPEVAAARLSCPATAVKDKPVVARSPQRVKGPVPQYDSGSGEADSSTQAGLFLEVARWHQHVHGPWKRLDIWKDLKIVSGPSVSKMKTVITKNPSWFVALGESHLYKLVDDLIPCGPLKIDGQY